MVKIRGDFGLGKIVENGWLGKNYSKVSPLTLYPYNFVLKWSISSKSFACGALLLKFKPLNVPGPKYMKQNPKIGPEVLGKN